eukprot:CAMPEP_0168320066 /NCGR_PEP_ID=MMETSP0213-20121227/1434_1 /TAXON_ID=151035 /ORGANISM="Euplotes harpa, Strain FSP1.4" /LENGTH=109 /DNA_ID=CAMNT_0008321415 /DNA_START=1127 /DNA_END=1459 /DNA_ORIENTATION=+
MELELRVCFGLTNELLRADLEQGVVPHTKLLNDLSVLRSLVYRLDDFSIFNVGVVSIMIDADADHDHSVVICLVGHGVVDQVDFPAGREFALNEDPPAEFIYARPPTRC